jgi:hypothetical protein
MDTREYATSTKKLRPIKEWSQKIHSNHGLLHAATSPWTQTRPRAADADSRLLLYTMSQDAGAGCCMLFLFINLS